jgi:hypothetical protein
MPEIAVREHEIPALIPWIPAKADKVETNRSSLAFRPLEVASDVSHITPGKLDEVRRDHPLLVLHQGPAKVIDFIPAVWDARSTKVAYDADSSVGPR